MSGKLDKSLDEIVSTGRAGARRRGARRSGGAVAPKAPVGGIQKSTRNTRAVSSTKPAPAKLAGATGESKIIVSNLPKDVTEAQIKEYFVNAVGSIKRVEITYGPNGISRGIANVTFREPDGASKAFKTLNGLRVDNKPIKIEIVVSSADAVTIPAAKPLSDRVTQPKAQPKSAATDKAGTKDARGTNGVRGRRGGARGGARGRGARTGRPAFKTTEELDSDMVDYFQNTGADQNGTGAAAPTAAAGVANDAQMEDEAL